MSKIPSPAYHAASLEIKAGLFSEEMRLLYVAATRAENKLIFTGTKKIDDKDYDKLDVAVPGRKRQSAMIQNISYGFLKCCPANATGLTTEKGAL